MKWGKEKPKSEGWYWMRKNWITCAYVQNENGKFFIAGSKIPDNAEWAGPIPEPKDCTIV